MPSRHLSIRIDTRTFDRLTSESRRGHRSRSDLAKTLIEEGLRMEAHPGIVFRDGPAGRRPGLAAGPDVWEVVRGFENGGENTIRRVSKLLWLTEEQVRTAFRYYAEYRDEIDAWIRRVDEEAEEGYSAWLKERELLGT
jgi:hypothetical protein